MILHLRSDLPVHPGCETVLTATAPPTFKALACDPPLDPQVRERIQRNLGVLSVSVGWKDVEGGDLLFRIRVGNFGKEVVVAEFDLIDRDSLIDTETGYWRIDMPGPLFGRTIQEKK